MASYYFALGYIKLGYTECAKYTVPGYTTPGYYDNCDSCIAYTSPGYIAPGYYDSCITCEAYTTPGYVVTGYYDSCGACITYTSPGYITPGYYDSCETQGLTKYTRFNADLKVTETINASTLPGFYAENTAEITKLITRAIRPTVFNTEVTATTDLELQGLKFVTISEQAIVETDFSPSYYRTDIKFIETLEATTNWKPSNLSTDNLVNIVNELKQCCLNLSSRVEAIEKDYLIAKDIEPLFSEREVHYDVQWPGNS